LQYFFVSGTVAAEDGDVPETVVFFADKLPDLPRGFVGAGMFVGGPGD
jgi:hypothetical protein